MRPARGTAGCRITPPIRGQALAERIFHGQRRGLSQSRQDGAADIQPRGGKGARGAACREFRIQAQHQRAPGRRHGHRMPRHGIFKPSEPGRVRAAFRQQPITLGHGIVMRRHFPRMARLKRPNQPIQKAPPATRPFLEQPVHLRRDPNGGHAFGQHRLAAQSLTIQAIDAPFCRPFRVRAGADIHGAGPRFKPPCHRPGQAPAGFLPPNFTHARAAQASTGGEQRYRFQQIGLARAVFARDANQGRVERRIQNPPGPKIRKSEARKKKPRRRRHTRIGIRTNSASGRDASRTMVGAAPSANRNSSLSCTRSVMSAKYRAWNPISNAPLV